MVDPRAVVRPAATVMLIRDSVDGPEVFVLRRVPQMEFAPRMTVFPGGAVDPADHEPSINWVGPGAGWWASRLGARADSARALVVAAVRELFEETGVLLATPGSGSVLTPDVLTPDVLTGAVLTDTTRLAILDGRSTLPEALAAAGLSLRADLLRPWANWITPPGRTRRYDTFFFAASIPDGQTARLLTTEADLGQWRTPRALLAERDAGQTRLMPPTVAMMTDLAAFGSVAGIMAEERTVTPVRVRASDFPHAQTRDAVARDGVKDGR